MPAAAGKGAADQIGPAASSKKGSPCEPGRVRVRLAIASLWTRFAPRQSRQRRSVGGRPQFGIQRMPQSWESIIIIRTYT